VFYKYLTAVRGAKRLSTTFHFKGESLELDSRASRDVERMVNFLADNGLQEAILAGFSDRKEDAVSNIEGRSLDTNYAKSLEDSCKRAQIIKDELSSRGIRVLNTLCVGSEMPIASNATALGRAKNRRVEVWVR
jgi:phosphate transport system substrate-binding protein